MASSLSLSEHSLYSPSRKSYKYASLFLSGAITVTIFHILFRFYSQVPRCVAGCHVLRLPAVKCEGEVAFVLACRVVAKARG